MKRIVVSALLSLASFSVASEKSVIVANFDTYPFSGSLETATQKNKISLTPSHAQSIFLNASTSPVTLRKNFPYTFGGIKYEIAKVSPEIGNAIIALMPDNTSRIIPLPEKPNNSFLFNYCNWKTTIKNGNAEVLKIPSFQSEDNYCFFDSHKDGFDITMPSDLTEQFSTTTHCPAEEQPAQIALYFINRGNVTRTSFLK